MLVMYAVLTLCLLGGTFAIERASIFTAKPPDNNIVDGNSPEFGVVGDGIHDDTQGIIAAINKTYVNSTCSSPGSRVVVFEGNGKKYLISGTIRIPIWVRLIGWGATRPEIMLAASTQGFHDPSQITPMFLVVDWVPNLNTSCPSNPTDGGNTAFGCGMMNIDINIARGNAGAVGIKNRAAQGGILRAMQFLLADDAAAGVFSPGWAHQDLEFIGGNVGLLMYETGAWPSVFRDCVFSNQRSAAVHWMSGQSPWEGITLVRVLFQNVSAAVNLSTIPSTRVTVLDSHFVNVKTALLPPDFAQGLSSVLFRNCSGSNTPVLIAPSNIGPAYLSPTQTGFFAISELVAGAITLDVRSPSGTVPKITIQGDTRVLASLPALPASDTPAMPPVALWDPVTDHGLVGDGVTDNTLALKALLAAAKPGSALYFPLGVYVVSDTIDITADPANGLMLFGLSCWDVVLTLKDSAPGYANPSQLKPVFRVTSTASRTPSLGLSAAPPGIWLSGLNIRTAQTYSTTNPPPVPAGWANPNPGALALLWTVPSGGLQDVFFHPASFPDNRREGTGPNTELSLVVAEGGGGVFADIWSCNSYSMGGVMVTNTSLPTTFYQLSSEHHLGHELWVHNATNVRVHCMQTEDRSPDAAPTSSITLEHGSSAVVTGLWSYYAANVPSAASVFVDATSQVSVAVYRQYHSYHPMYYNCSLLAELPGPAGGSTACIKVKDFALAIVKAP